MEQITCTETQYSVKLGTGHNTNLCDEFSRLCLGVNKTVNEPYDDYKEID